MAVLRPHAALPAAEGMVPALVNETRATMFLVGLDGVVYAVMGRGLDSLGIETAGLVGRDVSSFLPAAARVGEHVQRAAAGEAGELLVELPEGELEIRYAPVRDGDGGVRAIAATAWDVTGRRAAEHELRQLVEELQVVLANAPLVMFAFDRHGVVTLSEGRALIDAGLSRNVHVGDSVFEIWKESPLARMARRALAGETCHSISEVPSLGRTFQTVYRPIRDAEGDVVSVVAVSVDISERMAVERARSEAEARMRFLAGVSHELRTPLNSILGFAQLLAQGVAGDLTDRQARYVENILGSGHHVLSLVNDLLDIERLAAGRRELQVQRLAMDALVNDVLDEVAPLVRARELDVELEAVPAPALADDRAARQILLNLLSNAIKFSPEGTRLRLRTRRRREKVEVEVSDAGPGIPRDRWESIFDEFAVMASVTASPPQPSTGLGLCLSRRLARAMGGDLRVRSAGTAGSTFMLTLPVA